MSTDAGIERLLASYALLLDTGDVPGCANLFVEEGELVIVGHRPHAGREELQRFFARAPRGVHLPGPALVDVDPDGGTATILQSFLFVQTGSNIVSRGMYRDVVCNDSDGWRFRRRHIEMYPEGA